MKSRIDADRLPSQQVTDHDGMVWIPGGTFNMGSDTHYAEEYPVHRVTVDGFWMDRCAVTNQRWSRFVEATGYLTMAERLQPQSTEPASMVFREPTERVDLRNCYNWWTWLPGADWRHPEGPASSLEGRDEHPVVHIAYEDAEAYATWMGAELPTEAEWEFAARGGLDGAEYVWGNEFTPAGTHLANTWQGEFPWQNLKGDGYERTSPVAAFPPNSYGLYDMAGNVWEWTSDWFREHSTKRRCCGAINPSGGRREESIDPRLPLGTPRKVIKGGSFLCAPNHSRRYRPAARLAHPIDASTCDLGFRCIIRTETKPDLIRTLRLIETTCVYSAMDL